MIANKKINLVFVLVVLINFALNAQVKFFNYSCPNNVKSIADDGNYFWTGTSGGLYKWNKSGGTLIAKYDTETGLPSNDINCIKIDDIGGGLWVGTNNGAVKINGTVLTTYTTNDGLINNTINSITVNIQGVWFGTDGGISLLNGTNWTNYTTSNSGLWDSAVYAIAIDPSNNKWIGTGLSGLQKFDGTTWNTVSTTLSNVNYVITIDVSGILWIGGNNYITKYDGSSFTQYNIANGQSEGKVSSISIDVSGNKWVGCGHGVSKFNGSSWTNYTTVNGLINNDVTCSAIDISGNKWFGTRGGGVSKFDGASTWTAYVSTSGLINNEVNYIAIDALNVKWFATSLGVSKFDGSNWTSYTTANGLISNYVFGVAIDGSGNKWFATDGGVSKFNGSTWTNYTTSNGLPGNEILSIAAEASGNIWVGTYYGLSKFNGTTWTNYTTGNSGLVDNIVYAIAVDASNIKWFGTTNGVSKFDGTTWTTYTTSDGLGSTLIWDIKIDALGKIWFGTNSGVSVFDGTSWTSYTTSDGLIDNSTWAVNFDQTGNVWAGTFWSMGLTKFKGPLFRTFNTSDGLAGNEVRSISGDSQNNVWVGTSLGGVSKISCEAPVCNFLTDTICFPGITTFTNISNKTDIFTTYEWDINNDGTVEYTNENISHDFLGYGTYTVKLTAHNENCSSSVIKTVKVNSSPNVSLSHEGIMHICFGNSVTIDAIINNYDAGITYSYLWSTGEITPQISVNTTDTFSVTVSDNNCHGISSIPLNLTVQSVNQDQEMCLVTVDSTSTNNLIIWDKLIDLSIKSFLIYRDTANNNFGLIGEVPYDSLSLFIDTARNIYAANGDPNFSSWRYKIAIKDTCDDISNLSSYHQSIFLQNNNGNFNWSQYQIEGQSQPVPALTNYLFQRDNLSDGNYITIATLSASSTLFTDPSYATYENTATWRVMTDWGISCVSTKAQTHNTTRSNVQRINMVNNPIIFDNNKLNIVISPNPTNGKFTIQIIDSKLIADNSKLTISNVQGEIVYQSTINKKCEIDISELASGLYIVSVNSGTKVYHQKLVKE